MSALASLAHRLDRRGWQCTLTLHARRSLEAASVARAA